MRILLVLILVLSFISPCFSEPTDSYSNEVKELSRDPAVAAVIYKAISSLVRMGAIRLDDTQMIPCGNIFCPVNSVCCDSTPDTEICCNIEKYNCEYNEQDDKSECISKFSQPEVPDLIKCGDMYCQANSVCCNSDQNLCCSNVSSICIENQETSQNECIPIDSEVEVESEPEITCPPHDIICGGLCCNPDTNNCINDKCMPVDNTPHSLIF